MMLAILTGNVTCGECGRPGSYVMVNIPERGFVTQLCPLHLAAFVQDWHDHPTEAYGRLRHKRTVIENGDHDG